MQYILLLMDARTVYLRTIFDHFAACSPEAFLRALHAADAAQQDAIRKREYAGNYFMAFKTPEELEAALSGRNDSEDWFEKWKRSDDPEARAWAAYCASWKPDHSPELR